MLVNNKIDLLKCLILTLTISGYQMCGKRFDTTNNIGIKIGHAGLENYQFDIDTTSFKKQLEDIVEVPNVKLDKIEIRKSSVQGKDHDDYYMLIAYDHSKFLKIARWLVKDHDSFYYFKNNTEEDIPDEIFYRTYYTCYGSSILCFPQVYYIDGQYIWAASEKLYCAPDDPCKATSTFIPNE